MSGERGVNGNDSPLAVLQGMGGVSIWKSVCGSPQRGKWVRMCVWERLSLVAVLQGMCVCASGLRVFMFVFVLIYLNSLCV